MVRVVSILILCFGFIGSARAADHVKTTLIADTTSIRPGQSFTIGVLLEIDPGWHIYWTNPGDSGMATIVKFSLPDGYKVSANPFPVPLRISQPGNEVVYGYEKTVLITATVTPPENLAVGGEVPISAAVRWLVCKEQCLPGKSAETLTLRVADHVEPANVGTFEKYRSTVMSAGQLPADVAEVRSTSDSTSHVVTMTIRWKTLVDGIELFPEADDAVSISNIVVGKTENGSTPITLTVQILPGQTPASERLRVLVAYRDAKASVRGFTASVPLK